MSVHEEHIKNVCQQTHKQRMALDEQRRRRELRKHRLAQGLVGIAKRPWTALAILVICGVFTAAWFARGVITPPNASAGLAAAFNFTLAVGLALLCLFSLLGALYLLGTPPRAAAIEADIATALGLSKSNGNYYRRPFLISKRPMPEGDAITFTFWSKWQSIADWKDAQDSILWALQSSNCGAEFLPGRKAYTIVVTVVPGVVPKERETPYDPLFQ